MFRKHQPVIAEFARQCPENMARVIQFAILSARVRFYNMPATIEAADMGGEDARAVLWRHRQAGYENAWLDRENIFYQCEDIWGRGPMPKRERADSLLIYLSSIPGLELTKAGFTLQMIYGVSGCLDSVNVSRLGLKFQPHRGPYMKAQRSLKRKYRLASFYNGYIYRLGGPEKLWNDWCAEIANRYPAQFKNPHAVSKFHLTCLNLD